ncbi:histidine phosphatase family protein [Erysipelothrix sp. HDW6C]|uniref:histidine phosphatase family protein n=1 Tax=Erysipelothrix sp. HDW6C TaxID=2714930 RepID=UPI00140B2194|nr:histidine phosphatase family protein [Erysipelothrix sp. HDW6C]QIK69113.1 histidine phosphatase family protein [Erysipelothrix sp. HDW6C]
MKKTFYIMRHGQTVFNLLKKVQGFSDSPLTSLGIEQAKIAGAYFKDKEIYFDAAFSSTSERASDTLELVTDMPYTRLKGLKEWNFGLFESESEALNPKLPYGDFFVAYGGEGEKPFQKRIVDTMNELAQTQTGSSILVVAHGAVLGQFGKYWEHEAIATRDKKGRIGNCAIFKYVYENEVFRLEEIIEHDFSHLV